ncbi:SHOCT domain-containing protein [Halalkalicoccus salilacus]|uniref:SHOCT domain-containing protein n=1 Tax=Halalkalicoccus salilacus TaxID=3117459 RepID=UPI00300F2492
MVDGVVDFAILAVSIVSVLLGVMLLAAGEVFALTAIIIGVLGFAYLKTEIDQISEWRSSQSSSDTDPQQDALTILRERYARGEIDQDEFERRLDDLLETATVEQAEQHYERTPIKERE